MSNSSRLVPGGGLTAHENAGGHTLARHVGLTVAQLASRLANEPVPIASSFRDRTIAEAVISEALDANQAAITAWLSGNPSNIERFRYTASSQIGMCIYHGSVSPVPAINLIVVLKPDASLQLGYYILTAYPEP